MMEITAKEYLKSKGIWLGTTVPNMGAPEVYYSLEEMLEQYHQSKLKNHSDLSNVSDQRELLISFMEYLSELTMDIDSYSQEELLFDFKRNL